ncbi:MAG TPA: coproporphyrinogen-III oxidase family protein [Blastocatellia bacterium]|nr:coproporphyrinogen-III oxidase family protein [Blastocatellia bacterium]
MASALYNRRPLELTRKHFINLYPPFNIASGRETQSMDEKKDLLLYVHIPFCPTICSYCFYKKFGNPSEDVVDTYLRYLKKEITLFSRRPEVQTKSVRTMYFGGGTPTILNCRQLKDLVGFLRRQLDCDNMTEFCCEAMPHETTLDREKLELLKELGVTRLSFGMENLNDDILRLHNRHCTRELYYDTYKTVQEIGFDKVNVDIMSGMVGETWENWTDVIGTLIEWGPPSISIYKTELFYNTALFAKMRNGKADIALISDEEEIEHMRYAHERLQREGGYVVANCLHLVRDRKYVDEHYELIWQGGEFKGLGLSAHSSYEGYSHQNASEMEEYFSMIEQDKLPIKRAHRLSARDRLSVAMVYGLKNLAINRARFVEQFGVDMTAVYGDLLADLVGQGVLTLDDEWLRITPDYYLFADDVCRQFFLPEYENMMLAHVPREAASGTLVSLGSSK